MSHDFPQNSAKRFSGVLAGEDSFFDRNTPRNPGGQASWADRHVLAWQVLVLLLFAGIHWPGALRCRRGLPPRSMMLEGWLQQLGLTVPGLAWVAFGSALGGTARFALSGFVARRFGEIFPWGTIVVNVTGAFAIGMIAAAARHVSFDLPDAWQFAVVGVLGSYTTVSSFSLQTLTLARDGQHGRAAGNVLLSVGLCLSAVAVGFLAGGAGISLAAS